MGYASRTGTRRNLSALRSAGWRLLLSATGVHRTEGFRYAIDNGAWTAFQQGRPFDSAAFERLIWTHGSGADWIVVPDVVANRVASLRMTSWWLPHLDRFRLLVAVQNGMVPADVRPWLGARCGIFLGGDTAWKLETMRGWGDVAAEAGCHYHVARVNSAKRIARAQEAGANSFDGTSASRFSDSLGRLDRAVRQGAFAWEAA
jgi:hypothetical protein